MAELDDPQEPTVEDLLKINLVAMQRIYEVLLVDLRDRRPELAKKLVEAHEKFEPIGPMPYITEE